MRWPFVSRRERIRREAADWLARLNGEYDENDRAEFERWYQFNPQHAAAYDRISAVFEAAGMLRRPGAAGTGSFARAPGSRFRPLGYAFAAAAVCAALFAFFVLSARTVTPVAESGQQVAAFSAEGGESERIFLADGSEVFLSAGSRLKVAIGPSERRLRLDRGEARFAVASGVRPFIVEANGTEVTARGTLFVVQVDRGRTKVSLIEGRVDVSYPPEREPAGQRRVAQLEPGQQLVVEAQTSAAAKIAAAESLKDAPRPRSSTPSMLQFDDVPLAKAVEQVNRHGRPLIRLADPALGALRVTGAFQTGDTKRFAEAVAAAFNLEVESGPDGSLRLLRRSEAGASTKNFGG